MTAILLAIILMLLIFAIVLIDNLVKIVHLSNRLDEMPREEAIALMNSKKEELARLKRRYPFITAKQIERVLFE